MWGDLQMKKLSIYLAVCFLLLFVFMTPGLFAATNSKDVFVLWYSMPQEDKTAFETIIAEYNETNKFGMKIDAKHFSNKADLKKALFESTDMPDIALIDVAWQEELVRTTKIKPVEDIIREISTMMLIVMKNDTFKPVWEACKTEDKLWTMPYYSTSHALIYDKAIFKEYKIKAPPATWNDLVVIGKKLTDSSKGRWGLALTTRNDPEELANVFQIFLWQMNSDIQKSPGEFQYDEKATKLLKFWVELASIHKVLPIALPDDYTRVAMFVGNSSDYFKQKGVGRELSVVPLPKKEKKVTVLDVTSVAIFKAEPVKIRKSWNFVYWLTEHQQAVKWGLTSPYIPANKQVTLCPEYFNYLNENPGMRIFINELKSARLDSSREKYAEGMKSLGEKIENALQGKMKIEDVF